MRILRITVATLFIVVTCLFILFKIRYSKLDKTYPVITFDSDRISVPLDAKDADILAGVSAYDEKDGDISDKIIVESISRFTEPGVSVVKYSVCDEDKHVASAKRKIIYDGYEHPHFTLKAPLVFPIGQTINIHGIVGAVDLIEGDISDKVIITADEYTVQNNGIYTISAKVTNSKGDMISRTFPVYIEERSLSAPDIALNDYLIYCKPGDKLDPAANITYALTADGTDLKAGVSIETKLDTSVPGMYEVHYRVADAQGRQTHAMAIVIVEE